MSRGSAYGTLVISGIILLGAVFLLYEAGLQLGVALRIEVCLLTLRGEINECSSRAQLETVSPGVSHALGDRPPTTARSMTVDFHGRTPLLVLRRSLLERWARRHYHNQPSEPLTLFEH